MKYFWFLCKHLLRFQVLWALCWVLGRTTAWEAFRSHRSKDGYGHVQTWPPEGNEILECKAKRALVRDEQSEEGKTHLEHLLLCGLCREHGIPWSHRVRDWQPSLKRSQIIRRSIWGGSREEMYTMWETSHLLGASNDLLSEIGPKWTNSHRGSLREGHCCWVVRLDGHHGLLWLYNFWTTKNILKWVRQWKCIQAFYLISSCLLHPSRSLTGRPFFLADSSPSCPTLLCRLRSSAPACMGCPSVDGPFPLPLDFSCWQVYLCRFVQRVVRLTAPTNAPRAQV